MPAPTSKVLSSTLTEALPSAEAEAEADNAIAALPESRQSSTSET